MNRTSANSSKRTTLAKAPTGIDGMDAITNGGLPRGRPTLVCGGAGCGKTLFAMEFLVRGATEFDEPGVFMAFEETTEELTENVRSLGFDLEQMVEQKKLDLDFVRIEPGEIQEAGEYDLEGLFVRLGFAIDSIGAKRVVLDTIETLFGGLSDQTILRSELRRLFRWLKDRGVTAVITGERGGGVLTRQGLEEYVSDCVILLENRVVDQISCRRLRVVKYRGTTHGTDEYPFLIDENGISVLPITSLGLMKEVGDERISTGVSGLDEMMEGKGLYRGSSVLVSGTAGCGKSTLAAHFADAACSRGERVLYFAFEESPGQIIRNMKSVGIDLARWMDEGLLHFEANRSSVHGLEMHLVTFHKLIRTFDPQIIVVDPISSMLQGGTQKDANAMVTRLIDFLKSENITAFLTNLTSGNAALENTSLDISSLIDTWLLLRDVELGGERNRVVYILKSRGMSHSNQLREFMITSEGVKLREAYIGPAGVLTGSMRVAQEAREREEQLLLEQELGRRRRELKRKQDVMEAQVAALRKEYAAEAEEVRLIIEQGETKQEIVADVRDKMAESRHVDTENTDLEAKEQFDEC